jgi:hypothetical protein
MSIYITNCGCTTRLVRQANDHPAVLFGRGEPLDPDDKRQRCVPDSARDAPASGPGPVQVGWLEAEAAVAMQSLQLWPVRSHLAGAG